MTGCSVSYEQSAARSTGTKSRPLTQRLPLLLRTRPPLQASGGGAQMTAA